MTGVCSCKTVLNAAKFASSETETVLVCAEPGLKVDRVVLSGACVAIRGGAPDEEARCVCVSVAIEFCVGLDMRTGAPSGV